MKKILILLFIIIQVSAFAQTAKISKDSLIVLRTKSIKNLCKLDSSQTSKVFDLNKQLFTKLDAAYDRKTQSVAKKDQLKDADKWYRGEIKKILSKKQYDFFMEAEKKREEEVEAMLKQQKKKYEKIEKSGNN
jgi:hypothetical protein